MQRGLRRRTGVLLRPLLSPGSSRQEGSGYSAQQQNQGMWTNEQLRRNLAEKETLPQQEQSAGQTELEAEERSDEKLDLGHLAGDDQLTIEIARSRVRVYHLMPVLERSCAVNADATMHATSADAAQSPLPTSAASATVGRRVTRCVKCGLMRALKHGVQTQSSIEPKDREQTRAGGRGVRSGAEEREGGGGAARGS
eukprot:2415308-Rhodomonas_salina.1